MAYLKDMKMPRSFALGDRFENFIDSQIRGGRYNNASEVVRDALRLLENRELRVAELYSLAEEGRRSGVSVENGEDVLNRLEAKYKALVQSPAA